MTKPRVLPIGVKTIKIATPTMVREVRVSHILGRLRKNGVLAVLIINITNISVEIDSINHPV